MRALDAWLPRDVPRLRGFLATAGALAACSAALTIAQAVLFADIVVAGFLESRDVHDVMPALLCLAGVGAARAAICWIAETGARTAASRMTRALRERVLERVALARRGSVSSGEAVTATTDGVEALEGYVARFLPQLMTAALAPPAILAWAAFHDLPSALVMTVTLPLIPLFGALIGRSTQARTRERWRALARMSGHFLDVVNGLTTLRAHRRGRAQATTIAATTDRYRAETMRVLRVAFLSAFVLELAATLGTALVAVGIGIRLTTGGLGLRAGLAILVLTPELYGPLRALAAEFHAAADGLTASRRLSALLALPPAVSTPAHPRPAAFGTLRLKDVSARYDGPPVLSGISLEIRPGERTALVGDSGAGKSTLLALLMRFLEPSSGLITVAGSDLAAFDPAQWRRLVGWLPQRPRLRPGPVLEAITPAEPGALSPAAAAELLGAGPLLDRTVGEAGAGLSSGELRRLALARALARPAPLLLLDEPTAHLDADTARRVSDTILALPGRTIVVATHDARLASGADQVIDVTGLRAGILT
ncbi:thiol reductant ABC exporter subunit CydD [Actinomadura verrucosospora]|uniref:ABC transporter ATP-binding protein n=1 Tax=Actinomadura verrucosospora TaxID=46165 RepID=A0A7D4A2P6_ACTVE|nr:thiol reductant ABC exporter subunit CydD [Actinomadura verrucosospora]QKG18747.1 ABC transporter ATP-binding protein [Actinomadura verrucosospora]